MDAVSKSAKSRSVFSWFWPFFGLLPVGFAFVAWAQGSTPSRPAEAPERPSLVFHTHLVKYVRVPPKPVVGARFFFVNRGQEPVTIREAKPSCGCLKPRLAKRVWQPGERGEIILPVQTPNQKPGYHEYTVTIKYEDPEPRETVLRFQVNLPQKQVMVSPPALAVYQLGTRRAERTILVSDYPKLGFRITNVTCDSPYAKVTIGNTKLDPFGHKQHEVHVKVDGSIPPGRHHSVVIIETDNLRYRKLKVPLYVIGPRAKTAGGDQPFPRR